jgi:hypothetical protein
MNPVHVTETYTLEAFNVITLPLLSKWLLSKQFSIGDFVSVTSFFHRSDIPSPL